MASAFAAALVAGFSLCLASPATSVQLPGEKTCGDFAGPVWRVFGAGESRGMTGRHYTVSANIPCATARALGLKMTRKRSPGPGFSSAILPGWTCLLLAPAGQPLVIGGCTKGIAAPKPTPTGAAPGTLRGFNWHHCVDIPRGSHPTCTWREIRR